MKEKISIYIPVFNSEKTIKNVINSLFTQSKKFNEIIIVNDGSTDKTLEIIKSYKNIKIINNFKNKGLAATRNIAIKNCKNKIVANIDSDVVLSKHWLKNITKCLKKKKIIMCGGNTKEKFTKNIYNKWRSERYPLNWGDKDILNPPFIFGSNSIQYKSAWKKVGGYDEKFKTAGDDVNYSKKISSIKNSSTFYSNNSVCYHLQNDNLITLSNRVWRYHSFGYKNTTPSVFRFFKLGIKQLKILFLRYRENLINLNFKYFYIDLIVFILFIIFEFNNFLKKK